MKDCNYFVSKNHFAETPEAGAYLRKLSVGAVELPNNVFLAPMAGGSDLSYRIIANEMGAGLVCTELVSARGLRFAKSLKPHEHYLAIGPQLQPTAIQLFGPDPEDFSAALDVIFAHPDYRYVDIIDINMGCPVRKVVKSGSGSALLLDPERAAAIVRTVSRICHDLGKACSVKTRLGFEAGSYMADEFCLRLAEAGADMITLHGRTRSQMYAGKADWALIARTFRHLRDHGHDIALIANGDIRSEEDACRIMDETEASGIMVGRACLGNPWLLSRILYHWGSGSYLPKPNKDELVRVIRQHVHLAVAEMGETKSCTELRKTLAYYVSGTHGAAALRGRAAHIASLADVEAFLDFMMTTTEEYINAQEAEADELSEYATDPIRD